MEEDFPTGLDETLGKGPHPHDRDENLKPAQKRPKKLLMESDTVEVTYRTFTEPLPRAHDRAAPPPINSTPPFDNSVEALTAAQVAATE
jgi:hypothetical protein